PPASPAVAPAAAAAPAPAAAPPPPPNKVEELFTRLRAERRRAASTPASQPAPVPTAQGPGGPPAPAPASPPGLDPVASETALTGRDGLLDNVESGLARALKRVLQNEQNAVLDNLRRLGLAGAVLPDPEAHLATYRDTALPWLEQAARAGAAFASDPPREDDAGSAAPGVDAHALTLAGELVEPLRARLQQALDDTAGSEDPAVAGEALRTVYRQWKARQMDDAARHHAAAAFAAGAFGATPDGALLQWVVDDDGHCPDCDDNALAGPTTKGQPFPTGQLHPPAHRGCRCLLVSART
ncbi:MAG: hypothetical protein M3066_09930, partial [Actinomycetota bacterium]|nr:hypothetical protein [Actinomycetota bacterium]